MAMRANQLMRSMRDFEETLIHTAAEDITEEKFEDVLKKFDLNWLMTQPTFAGAVARAVASVPADLRLVFLSVLAAVLERQTQIHPLARFVGVAALRALPQALPSMLNKQNVKADRVERAINERQEQVRQEISQVEAYVGVHQTDLIHLSSTHPPAQGDGAPRINRGSLLEILERHGDAQPLCPVCFRKELAVGKIAIEVQSGPAPERKAMPLELLSKIDDRAKRRFVVQLARMAANEMEGDPGIGLEGRGFTLWNAIIEGLTKDPKGFEALIPEPPPNMQQLAQLTHDKAAAKRRIRLALPEIPDETEEFITALLLAYGAEHPQVTPYVWARDFLDGLFRFLPKDLRPKQPGWEGVKETWRKAGESKLYAVLRWIVIIFLVLVAVGIVVLGLGLAASMIGIFLRFAPFFSWLGLFIELGLVTVFIARLILVLTDTPVAAVHSASQIGADVKTKPPEPVRSRMLVIGLATGVIGTFVTIALWGMGDITHPGVALFNIALMVLLVAIEATNKWIDYIDDEQRRTGVRRLLMVSLGTFAVLAILGTGFFLIPTSLTAEASTLTAGASQKAVREIGWELGVPVNDEQAKRMSREQCLDKRAAAELRAAQLGRPGYCDRKVAKSGEGDDLYPCRCIGDEGYVLRPGDPGYGEEVAAVD